MLIVPLPRVPVMEPRARVLPTKKHLTALQTYTKNPRAHWTCPEQGEAFALATNPGRQSLIIVMATGGGKSLFFLGTVPLEKGISVVIVPLRALMEDQIRAAVAKNIACYEWVDDSDPPFAHGIAFISIERVTGPFQCWCTRRLEAKSLIKIVIDEAHLILSSRNYRDAMGLVSTLTERCVPVICLTATLPPALERSLIHHIGDPTVIVVRSSTQRPNIAYHINRYATALEAGKELLRHVALLQQKLLGPGDGLLIICRTVARVREVHAEIRGATLWHSSEDVQVRADMSANAANWLSGDIPIMVATSGMGTGVHHPNCVAMLHDGSSSGAMAYSQETGRAGRDGRRSHAVMFHTGDMFTPPLLRGYTGYDEMKELLTTPGCIREKLSLYLDGPQLQTNCFSGPYELCGNCERVPAYEVAKQYVKTWVRGETCIAELKDRDVVSSCSHTVS
jgi:superfamily II DNA helicase RecQ